MYTFLLFYTSHPLSPPPLVQLLTTSLVKMVVSFDPFTAKIPSPEQTKTLMEGTHSVFCSEASRTSPSSPVCMYSSVHLRCCPLSSPQPWTARVC